MNVSAPKWGPATSKQRPECQILRSVDKKDPSVTSALSHIAKSALLWPLVVSRRSLESEVSVSRRNNSPGVSSLAGNYGCTDRPSGQHHTPNSVRLKFMHMLHNDGHVIWAAT